MASHPFPRLWTRLAAIGILLITGVHALANIPAPIRPRLNNLNQPPPPPKKVGAAATFVVRRDAVAEHSRIVIPKKFLPANDTDFRLYQPLNPAKASADPFGSSQRKAVNAGLLLATVISGGGLTVVFVRRRKMRAATGASVITLLLTIALGTTMAAQPPSQPLPDVPLPNAARQAIEVAGADSQVTVEIVERGSEIVLILGKDVPKPGG